MPLQDQTSTSFPILWRRFRRNGVVAEKAQANPERALSGATTSRSHQSFRKFTRVLIPLA
ncbi:Uncharacterised protein [Segatella copri]|nr:Uncharacterised protein [Segatella copri]